MELKQLNKISKDELQSAIDSPLKDFRLEQVEFNEEKKYWNVVVSPTRTDACHFVVIPCHFVAAE